MEKDCKLERNGLSECSDIPCIHCFLALEILLLSPCCKSLFFFFSAVSFSNSSSILSFLFDPSHFWILFSLQNQFLRSITSTLN
jgi:hypothetical protein